MIPLTNHHPPGEVVVRSLWFTTWYLRISCQKDPLGTLLGSHECFAMLHQWWHHFTGFTFTMNICICLYMLFIHIDIYIYMLHHVLHIIYHEKDESNMFPSRFVRSHCIGSHGITIEASGTRSRKGRKWWEESENLGNKPHRFWKRHLSYVEYV